MAYYRVVTTQTYHGKTVNNAYYYSHSSSGTAMPLDIANAFESQVLAVINTIQNAGVENVSTYVTEVNDPSNYGGIINTGGGNVGSVASGLGSFDAWSFRYGLIPSVIRYGYKRFAGVDESMVDAGQATGAAMGLLNPVAAALSAQLNVTGGENAIPYVLRLIGDSVPYIVTAAQVVNCIYRAYSTQNTRK